MDRVRLLSALKAALTAPVDLESALSDEAITVCKDKVLLEDLLQHQVRDRVGVGQPPLRLPWRAVS